MRNFSYLLGLFLPLSALMACNRSPSGANLRTERAQKETVPPKPSWCKANVEANLPENKSCVLLYVDKLWYERGFWHAIVSNDALRYTLALNEESGNRTMPLVGHLVWCDLKPGEIGLILGDYPAMPEMPEYAGTGTILKVEAKE